MIEESTQHAPEAEPIHYSYWPIILAFSLLLIAAGVVFSLIISVIGIIGLLVAIVGWTLENRAKPINQEVENE